MENKSLKRMVWVILSVLVISLVLVRSVATAESEFQADDPDPSASAAYDQRTNPNTELMTLEVEETVSRETLTLEASNYFVIPPSGFVNDGYSPDGYFISFLDGHITTIGEATPCMAAPVQLPKGATIEGIEAAVNDQLDSGSISFYLFRTNLETADTEMIASVISPEGTTAGVVSLVDDTVTYPTVSDIYAYQILTCLNLDIYVYGVRVGYSYNSYMPLVDE